MRRQQAILREHYDASAALRTRIDEIASEFLSLRRPNSGKHAARMKHMVRIPMIRCSLWDFRQPKQGGDL